MAGYLPGNIDIDLGLGTLPTKSGVPIDTQVVGEKRRVSSIKVTYTLSDWQVASNAGPVLVCVAHSDYTQAEIDAWIERTGAWSQADLIAEEVRRRKIRRIGIFPIPSVDGDSTVLNDGKPISTKLNWTLLTGQGLKFHCYNLGTANLIGSSNANFQGVAHLWPQA